jgi:hypothetical protein
LQDKKLKNAVEKYGTENWTLITDLFLNKSEAHCIRRYQSALMPPILRKSSWTPEEDAKISELVTKYGAKKWAFIASNLPGRKPKQCKYQAIRGVCFIVYAQATADLSCLSLILLFVLLSFSQVVNVGKTICSLTLVKQYGQRKRIVSSWTFISLKGIDGQKSPISFLDVCYVGTCVDCCGMQI